jgi:hypothetical protein
LRVGVARFNSPESEMCRIYQFSNRYSTLRIRMIQIKDLDC